MYYRYVYTNERLSDERTRSDASRRDVRWDWNLSTCCVSQLSSWSVSRYREHTWLLSLPNR